YWARQAAGIVMSAAKLPIRDGKGNVKTEHAPENLVLDQEGGVTADNPADLAKVVAAIKDEWSKYPDHPEFKNLKVGVFGNFPTLPPDNPDDPAAIDAWHAKTDSLASVAQQVDFIVPVLYAGETDPSDFAASMSLNIREARRYGKPVYAYIWPEYFEQL